MQHSYEELQPCIHKSKAMIGQPEKIFLQRNESIQNAWSKFRDLNIDESLWSKTDSSEYSPLNIQFFSKLTERQNKPYQDEKVTWEKWRSAACNKSSAVFYKTGEEKSSSSDSFRFFWIKTWSESKTSHGHVPLVPSIREKSMQCSSSSSSPLNPRSCLSNFQAWPQPLCYNLNSSTKLRLPSRIPWKLQQDNRCATSQPYVTQQI